MMAPAFSKRPGQQIATRDDGLSYAVTTGEPPRVLAAFSAGQSSKAGSLGYAEELAPTLRGGSSGTNQVPTMHDEAMVRRLTPTECERLQGFPDGWTEGVSDSTRYRMLGNAVCVPVAEWIGRRIVEVSE